MQADTTLFSKKNASWYNIIFQKKKKKKMQADITLFSKKKKNASWYNIIFKKKKCKLI